MVKDQSTTKEKRKRMKPTVVEKIKYPIWSNINDAKSEL